MLQSPVDIALIAGVVLLIFGPKKLPEVGKALGLGIGNFKRALFEAQDEVKSAVKTEPAHSQPGDHASNLTPGAMASANAVAVSASEVKSDVKPDALVERNVTLDEPHPITETAR